MTYEAHFADKTVVVTGGAGFIGSHLSKKLVSLGAKVRIIDDMSGGVAANIDPIRSDIEFVEASILDTPALAKVLHGADIIYHEAALASVPASIERPRAYHDVNIDGTVNVLETARAENVNRVVFASSSSVYGDQPKLPKHEDDPSDPLSPYAMQKLTGEYLMDVWSRCYGLTTISLRYFNIFGPGQAANSAYAAVIAAFATGLFEGNVPRIHGDGGATRDFTFIESVVQANLRAGSIDSNVLKTKLDGKPAIFNVANGVKTSVLELAEGMIKAIGVDCTPAFGPVRAGDVLHSVADVSKARDVLGFDPSVSLQDGLNQTMEWYREQVQNASV